MQHRFFMYSRRSFRFGPTKVPRSCQILGFPGVELTLSMCSYLHAKLHDKDADACKLCSSKHGGSEGTMVLYTPYLSLP